MTKIKNVDNYNFKDVEQLGFWYIVHGSINWYKSFGMVLTISIKAEYMNTQELAILSGNRETHTYVYQKIYMRKFIATHFVMDKYWN